MIKGPVIVVLLFITFRKVVLAFPGKMVFNQTGARGPCPALNTLANHGVLHRSGVNISVDETVDAVEKYFGYAPPLFDILRKEHNIIWKDELGVERINLPDLWNPKDFPASFIYQDGAKTPSLELLQGLEDAAGEDGILTYLELADWRDVRLEQYKKSNATKETPEDEYLMLSAHSFNSANIFVSFGGDPMVGRVPIDQVMPFMRENRFPPDFVPYFQKEGRDSARMNADDPLLSSIRRFFFERADRTVPVKRPSVHDCMSKFTNLQFDIQDYDKYPDYFKEDSRIVLAEAGEYVGPSSIEEYVKFADDRFSPYMQEQTGLHSHLKLKSVEEDGTCQFLVTTGINVEWGISDKRTRMVYGVLLHVDYDFHKEYIPNVYVHYAKDFLEFVFDDVLNTEKVRNYICDVSASCANMDVNKDISHKQCTQKLKDLPTFTNGAVDGNSFGCRALHAVFAQENQNHCAHISFEPKEDPNGKIKCQTSAGYSSLDFFDEDDLEDFRDFMESYPLLETREGIKVLSQDKEATSTWRRVFFGGVIPFILLAGSLILLRKKKEMVENSTQPNSLEQAMSNRLLDTKSNRLLILVCVVIGVLFVFNGLAYLIIWAIAEKKDDYWSAGTQSTYKDYYEYADRYHGKAGTAEDSSLHHMMDDDQYMVYVAFVVWITVLIAGFGLEVFVWYHFLQIWDKNRETMWKFAQFVFPLMLVTGLGLAIGHNYWSLPLLVLGMWKFGFPETLMYLYLGLFAKDHSGSTRLADFLNGIATVLHHGAVALCCSLTLNGVLPYSAALYNGPLILVMQHWVVLLSYVSIPLYTGVILVLEYYFEWIILSDFADLYNLHWALAMSSAVMLFAHWLYILAGLLEVLSANDAGDDDAGHNVHTRGNKKILSERTATDATTDDELFPDTSEALLDISASQDSSRHHRLAQSFIQTEYKSHLSMRRTLRKRSVALPSISIPEEQQQDTIIETI